MTATPVGVRHNSGVSARRLRTARAQIPGDGVLPGIAMMQMGEFQRHLGVAHIHLAAAPAHLVGGHAHIAGRRVHGAARAGVPVGC